MNNMQPYNRKIMIQRPVLLKIVLMLLVSVLASTGLHAQHKSMQLSTDVIDFGDIAAVMYPSKTLEFVNVSQDRLAILIVEKGPDVKAGYEHRFFESGEKGLITLNYSTGELGPFKEEIRIYTNLDVDPYIVTLKGNSITVESCFPDRDNLNKRNIMVINKLTQNPVPYAGVSFVHNFNRNRPIICKTDKSGKAVKELPIGQYNAQSVVEGYKKYDLDFFLPRSQPNILIELNPRITLPEVEPVAGPVITPEKIPVTSAVLPEDRYAANNIVLLLDVSTSMRSNKKLTLLKQSVNNLVMALRHIDNVSIITYAGDANVLLIGIPGSKKEEIMGVVQELTAYGITQGVKGLNTAYELATEKFITGGNNQIILATDGEFSEKNVSDDYYQQFISGYASKGIKLSILGFGVNEEAISRMKKMTSYGEGSYIHIGSEEYIKDVLINEIRKMSFMGE